MVFRPLGMFWCSWNVWSTAIHRCMSTVPACRARFSSPCSWQGLTRASQTRWVGLACCRRSSWHALTCQRACLTGCQSIAGHGAGHGASQSGGVTFAGHSVSNSRSESLCCWGARQAGCESFAGHGASDRRSDSLCCGGSSQAGCESFAGHGASDSRSDSLCCGGSSQAGCESFAGHGASDSRSDSLCCGGSSQAGCESLRCQRTSGRSCKRLTPCRADCQCLTYTNQSHTAFTFIVLHSWPQLLKNHQKQWSLVPSFRVSSSKPASPQIAMSQRLKLSPALKVVLVVFLRFVISWPLCFEICTKIIALRMKLLGLESSHCSHCLCFLHS